MQSKVTNSFYIGLLLLSALAELKLIVNSKQREWKRKINAIWTIGEHRDMGLLSEFIARLSNRYRICLPLF